MTKLTTIQVTQNAADELKRLKKELPVKKAADVLDKFLASHKQLQQSVNDKSTMIVDLNEQIEGLLLYPQLVKAVFPEGMSGADLRTMRLNMGKTELQFTKIIGIGPRALRYQCNRERLEKVFINTLRGAFIEYAFSKFIAS